jgi:hypothetical protein
VLRRTALTDLLGGPLNAIRPSSLKLTDLSRRGKALAYAGSALALTGVGAATAAAATSGATQATPVAAAVRGLSSTVTAAEHGPVQAGPAPAGFVPAGFAPAGSAHASSGQASSVLGSPVLGTPVPGRPVSGTPVLGSPVLGGPVLGRPVQQVPARSAPVPATAAARPAATRPGAAQKATTPGGTTPVGTTPVGTTPGGTTPGGTTQTAAAGAAAGTAHVAKSAGTSWREIRDRIARDTLPSGRPGALPLADRAAPGPAQGQQSFMPIGAAQMANATTIVRKALAMRMGLRSAVIAVATAMQESTLQNINYGDRDSLGLFQQRPSCGWGTAAQITDPGYAARAFLSALRKHQQADPGWAAQPLWANAQAVQNSGFPQAYAKWESQAAQLVTSIAKHLA